MSDWLDIAACVYYVVSEVWGRPAPLSFSIKFNKIHALC